MKRRRGGAIHKDTGGTFGLPSSHRRATLRRSTDVPYKAFRCLPCTVVRAFAFSARIQVRTVKFGNGDPVAGGLLPAPLDYKNQNRPTPSKSDRGAASEFRKILAVPFWVPIPRADDDVSLCAGDPL